jgi:hypothetical protein
MASLSQGRQDRMVLSCQLCQDFFQNGKGKPVSARAASLNCAQRLSAASLPCLRSPYTPLPLTPSASISRFSKALYESLSNHNSDHILDTNIGQ